MTFLKDIFKITYLLVGVFLLQWWIVTVYNYNGNLLLDREEALMNYRHAKCMNEVGLEYFPALEVLTEEDSRRWDQVRAYYACSTNLQK